MTRAEWDARWQETFNRIYNADPGRNYSRAQKRALRETETRFGPRPAGGGLPLKYRIAAMLLRRRLEGMVKGDVAMQKTIWQRLGYAAIYGLVAVVGALQVNGLPKTEEGWIAVAGVFCTTLSAKFSHPEEAISSQKAIWTPEERAAKTGRN